MTISSDIKVKRATVVYYLPTAAHLARHNPLGHAAILKWYGRAAALLELRRKRPVMVELEAYSQEFDAETKKPVGPKRGPTKYQIEKWKLSEEDYKIYKSGLEDKFAKLKRDHNEAVRAKKKAATEKETANVK